MPEPTGIKNVVPLGVEPIPEVPQEPAPMGRVHGLSTIGMALCAFAGIVAVLGLITIRWPGETSRYPKLIVVGSIIGFMVCAALAAAGAARSTYPRSARGESSGEPPE